MSTRARAANTFCARLLAGLLFALGVAHAEHAHAGPVEQFLEVALNPKTPDVMLLRYENGGDGVFYTRDGGKSWSLTCATAIDSAVIGGLSVGIAGDGTAMFAGSIGGSNKYSKTLWEDDKHGCGFARIGTLGDVWLSDIEVDPTDADVLYAASSGLEQGKLNGLWKRDADGVWSEVGPRERIMITRLRIVKTKSGLRMYASALREVPIADAGTGAKFSYDFVIRMSDDGGKTWDEQPFAGTDHTSFKLEAVDPGDPDTIVASVTMPEALGVPWKETQDHVVVSHDKGATFEEYLTLAEIGGVTFDGDGKVWIGDGGSIFYADAPQGLWMAKSLAEAPSMVAKEAVQCLAFQPATDTLFACQHQSLATVDHAHGGALTQMLRAVEVKSFAACDGVDMASACELQLCGAYCGAGHFAQAPVCEAYDTPMCGPAIAASEGTSDAGPQPPAPADASAAVRDAGGKDAATAAHDDAGSARLTGTDSGCSCAVVGGRAGGGAAALWMLGLLLVRGRRARRLRGPRRTSTPNR